MNKTTFSFFRFNKIRTELLKQNSHDFVFKPAENNILISAPHGVSQVRLGKLKSAEIGTIPIAVILAKNTHSNLIIKTKNLDDDANFVFFSNYRRHIARQIKTHHFKYIIDIHGLAKHRPCDINLGINHGQNIKNNLALFEDLEKTLSANGFSVSVDQPFAAGPQTISGYFAKEFNVWSVQIEINCAITNEPENIHKCNKLVEILTNWIESINKR